MLSLTLFLILALANVLTNNTMASVVKKPEKTFYDLEKIEELFEQFIADFGKQYESEKEYNNRLGVFRDNLIKINKMNEEHANVVFKMNHLSDLSHEEYLEKHSCYNANYTRTLETIDVTPTGMAPDSLDYRQQNCVTPVKNQGHCGSCYVFSAIGSIEGQYAKKYGKLVSLSEQQGLDCNPADCKGGSPLEVIQSLAQYGGSESEEDYPYEGVKGQCRTDTNKVVVKVTGGSSLNIRSADDMKEALYQYGPLSTSLYLSDQVKYYSGGHTLEPTDCSGVINHAVLLVGYGTDQHGVPYWLIKNSYDVTYGAQGYLYLVRGKNACQFETSASVSSVV